MSTTFVIFFCLLVTAVVAWRTGFTEKIFDRLGLGVKNGSRWLTSEEGAWADLLEHIPYRDFIDDVVETFGGWIWAGIEVMPIATDGFDGDDWTGMGEFLNRVLAGMPDKTWIQTVTKIDYNSGFADDIYFELSDNCPFDGLAEVMRARARHLHRSAEQGIVNNSRTYVFIACQSNVRKQQIPFASLFSSTPFIELERKEFMALREKVIRARDSFTAAYVAAKGSARPLNAREIYDLAYNKLNPERAETIPPPAYDASLHEIPKVEFLEEDDYEDVQINDGGRKVAVAGGDQLSRLLTDLMDDAILDEPLTLPSEVKAAPKPKPKRRVYDGRERLFADSPRSILCCTPIRVREDHFLVGDRLTMVVSLQRLPVQVFSGLAERLTRHPEIDFPLEVSTSFEVGEYQAWDEKLERMQKRIQISISRAKLGANKDEEIKGEEIDSIRTQLRVHEVKVGEIGFNVTISAPNVDELRRRRDLVMIAMRSMEGMEGVVERHAPLGQFLATLPCGPHSDFRRKPCLTQDAVAMMTLTGGPKGINPQEAIEVFERADGGIFYWNPKPRAFKSGMSLFCGSPGSGKSGALNRQRTALIAQGRRGITIDYGASSYRVCKAVGGTWIDITDVTSTRGLGLFAIKPQPGEEFEPEELNKDGIPYERLSELGDIVESLCLDPGNPRETHLEPKLNTFLRLKIEQMYSEACGETPTLDMLVQVLRNSLHEEYGKADELASRMEIYNNDGMLRRFLNDQSEPLSVNTAYTVFDFSRAVGNDRLMLVASMAVESFIKRFMRVDRRIKKFFDVDEFKEVSSYPLICRTIERSFRTARKASAICSVASQDPEDFAGDDKGISNIRTKCEVKWLFDMPNLNVAEEVFELRPGVIQALKFVQGNISEEFRDCVLTYPGGVAHLRLRFGPMDRRLLLGAGEYEGATIEEALADVEGPVDELLLEALTTDALGAKVATNITAVEDMANYDLQMAH